MAGESLFLQWMQDDRSINLDVSVSSRTMAQSAFIQEVEIQRQLPGRLFGGNLSFLVIHAQISGAMLMIASIFVACLP